MTRMDRIWGKPAATTSPTRCAVVVRDYVREHVRFTTQRALEDADTAGFREYLEMMDLGDNLMFSTGLSALEL